MDNLLCSSRPTTGATGGVVAAALTLKLRRRRIRPTAAAPRARGTSRAKLPIAAAQAAGRSSEWSHKGMILRG